MVNQRILENANGTNQNQRIRSCFDRRSKNRTPQNHRRREPQTGVIGDSNKGLSCSNGDVKERS
jgi:hypothetical protein